MRQRRSLPRRPALSERQCGVVRSAGFQGDTAERTPRTRRSSPSLRSSLVPSHPLRFQHLLICYVNRQLDARNLHGPKTHLVPATTARDGPRNLPMGHKHRCPQRRNEPRQQLLSASPVKIEPRSCQIALPRTDRVDDPSARRGSSAGLPPASGIPRCGVRHPVFTDRVRKLIFAGTQWVRRSFGNYRYPQPVTNVGGPRKSALQRLSATGRHV